MVIRLERCANSRRTLNGQAPDRARLQNWTALLSNGLLTVNPVDGLESGHPSQGSSCGQAIQRVYWWRQTRACLQDAAHSTPKLLMRGASGDCLFKDIKWILMLGSGLAGCMLWPSLDDPTVGSTLQKARGW